MSSILIAFNQQMGKHKLSHSTNNPRIGLQPRQVNNTLWNRVSKEEADSQLNTHDAEKSHHERN